MSPCPVCAGRLVVAGSRRRTRLTADGTRQVLVIRRWYCPACRRWVASLLPPVN